MKMIYYKPYSYLYKREADPRKLKSCFVSWVPKGKKLSFDRKITDIDKTTLVYIIEVNIAQLSDHLEENEKEIPWDGNPHDVEVLIGSGSGSDGGACVIKSIEAEDF